MSQVKARVKLTKKVIENLEIKPQEYAVWDTDVISFHLRILPGGTKSYCVYYRVDGKRRRRSIGSFPTVTVSDARDSARKIITAAKSGGDPFGERDRRKQRQTVSQLWDYYWETHAIPKKSASSQREDMRMWNKHLKPKFQKISIEDLHFDDVQKLHSALRRTPTEANRVVALISKMMSLAIRRGQRESNPCHGVERYPNNRRERILNEVELIKFFESVEREKQRDPGAAVMVTLLLLTGARRGEALKARWEDFDLNKKVWNVKRETLKGGSRHAITLQRALSDRAVELLVDWRLDHPTPDGLVFPSEEDPSKPRYDIKKQWDRIRTEAKLANFRLHDLRHCFATYAFRAGLPLAVIGEQMGHLSSSTTLRYAHVDEREKRRVAEVVSDAVLSGD